METEIERAKKSIKEYRKNYGQHQLNTDCIIQLMIEHSRTEQLRLLSVVRQSEQLICPETKKECERQGTYYCNRLCERI